MFSLKSRYFKISLSTIYHIERLDVRNSQENPGRGSLNPSSDHLHKSRSQEFVVVGALRCAGGCLNYETIFLSVPLPTLSMCYEDESLGAVHKECHAFFDDF